MSVLHSHKLALESVHRQRSDESRPLGALSQNVCDVIPQGLPRENERGRAQSLVHLLP